MKSVKIDFDAAKDAINRDKHGVSLAFAESVLSDPNRLVMSWMSGRTMAKTGLCLTGKHRDAFGSVSSPFEMISAASSV